MLSRIDIGLLVHPLQCINIIHWLVGLERMHICLSPRCWYLTSRDSVLIVNCLIILHRNVLSDSSALDFLVRFNRLVPAAAAVSLWSFLSWL